MFNLPNFIKFLNGESMGSVKKYIVSVKELLVYGAIQERRILIIIKISIIYSNL